LSKLDNIKEDLNAMHMDIRAAVEVTRDRRSGDGSNDLIVSKSDGRETRKLLSPDASNLPKYVYSEHGGAYSAPVQIFYLDLDV